MAFIPEFRLVCFKLNSASFQTTDLAAKGASILVEPSPTQHHQPSPFDPPMGLGPGSFPGATPLSVASSMPVLAQDNTAFASSRIGSRSGVVRCGKFFGCSSASFNRYEDMFEEDDASKVTLPAWPGQGYGRHWLFSGLLVQFVSCPYSDVFALLYDLDLCIVYLYLDSLESLLIYMFLVGSIVILL
ncbi:uncharacterized protein [Lolium perenne]|uniref:uncharacterized protein n=1 Tax=Lolium perenne TaxID=4522 RepID=UPI0021F68F0E|nr:uncharacterized protein LOC127342249 [Lolium perenne]